MNEIVYFVAGALTGMCLQPLGKAVYNALAEVIKRAKAPEVKVVKVVPTDNSILPDYDVTLSNGEVWRGRHGFRRVGDGRDLHDMWDSYGLRKKIETAIWLYQERIKNE